MVVEAETRGPKFDCTMEETGLRKVVLFKVHSDKGNNLWDSVHMSCAKGQVGKGDGGRVCALWMSRMRQ